MAEILKCQDASGAKLKSSNAAVNDLTRHMPAPSVDMTKKPDCRPRALLHACLVNRQLVSQSVTSSFYRCHTRLAQVAGVESPDIVLACIHRENSRPIGVLRNHEKICAVAISAHGKAGLDIGCTTLRTLPAAHTKLRKEHESCF